MTDPIRVLLVDDQSLVRSGFRMILGTRKDIVVVGEAEDGDQVLAAVDARVPDVVLMDVRMPRMDGIAATRELIRRHSRVRVLILTTFDLDEYVVEALRSGASGFLLKDSTAPELIAGVKAVARGDSVVAPSATRRLLRHWISQEDRAAGAVSGRREALAAGSPDHQGEGDSDAGGPRLEQPGDRRDGGTGGIHRQDLHQPPPAQALHERSCRADRARLRDRPHPTGAGRVTPVAVAAGPPVGGKVFLEVHPGLE